MLPFIHFLGFEIPVKTSVILGYSFLAGSALVYSLRQKIAFYKTLLLYVWLCLSFFIGCRLFYVFFETKELWKTPSLWFASMKGLTFYGGIFFSFASLWLFSRLIKNNVNRSELISRMAIVYAGGCAIMRIGCFLNGCCWGKICLHSWAVTYTHPRSASAFIGVPLHPVQLYDSLIGFAIVAILIYVKRNKHGIQQVMMPLFFWLYACGRFITEGFRGDAFRGNRVFGELSMSQGISVALIIICSFVLIYQLRDSWSLRVRSIKRLRLLNET